MQGREHSDSIESEIAILNQEIDSHIISLKNKIESSTNERDLLVWRHKIEVLDAAKKKLLNQDIDLEYTCSQNPYYKYTWNLISGWEESKNSDTEKYVYKAKKLIAFRHPFTQSSAAKIFSMDDIGMQIYLRLNNTSILSLFLTSKFFSEYLMETNSIWKKIMASQQDQNEYQFFERKKLNYKKEFLQKISWEKDNSFKHSFFSSYSRHLGTKYVNYKNAYQFIREDNGADLLNEVSELGALRDCIQENDISAGAAILRRYEWMYFNGLGVEFRSARGANIGFLKEFIPDIIRGEAKNCFELFIKLLSFIGTCFKTSNLTSTSLTGRYSLYDHVFIDFFHACTELVFTSSNDYFKFLYINFMLDQHRTLIIKACQRYNAHELLYDALDQCDLPNISEISQLLIEVGYPGSSKVLDAEYLRLKQISDNQKNDLTTSMDQADFVTAMKFCNKLNMTLEKMQKIKTSLDSIQMRETDQARLGQ